MNISHKLNISMKEQKYIMPMITLTILLMWAPLLAMASTGKISGTVHDKVTGEPLIGANVVIDGTYLGGATDADGYFFIIGIQPGKYDVKIRYIGYNTLTVKAILVRSGLTAKLKIQLEPEIIQGQAVTVFAEREIIQKDVTSTRRVRTADEIVNIPGMESMTDVLGLMTGVILDQQPLRLALGDGSQLQVRDESLKNIHVRGGRGGEILYVVDGMPVTHPIYGGRTVLDLNIEEVEQIELLTGGFNAEYGQAQSGVVNITTRSGSDKRIGGVEYKRDVVGELGRSQNSEYTSLYAGGNLGLFGDNSSLKKLYYFLSGNLSMADGSFDNGRQTDQISILNLFNLQEKRDNTANLNAKITWKFINSARFVLSYHGSWKRWNFDRGLDWAFRNFPNNLPEYSRNTHNMNLRYNQVLSKSTFFNVNIGYLDVAYKGSLDGKSNPADFWTITDDTVFTSVTPPRVDPATNFFNSEGVRAIWRDDRTKSVTFKTELVSQIHRDHLIKTGASLQYHDLQYIDINDGATKLSKFGEWKYSGGDYFDPPPGPFPEFGQTRWTFTDYPLLGDFFLQDKYELQFLILNVGLRLDWIYLGNRLNREDYKQKWESATGIPTDWDLLKTSVSPRFGVSFPLSEDMVLFFSYGHFNQLPELQFFYRDPWSGGFTGNPHMGFENTILYEFGLTRRLSDHLSIDVKSYGKDVANVVGTETIRAALGIPVSLHVNNGYGRARGIEVELNKVYSNFTTFNLGYTLQWANGYASSAFADFIREQEKLAKPIRERPLSWDVRHQVILSTSLISAPGKHMNLFGLRLPDNWSISLLTRFTSGEPYSPGTLDILEARVLENAASKPYRISSDLKINKSFESRFGGISVFLDIFSLFNRRNDLDVNFWTGEAIKYGDLVSGTDEIVNWPQMYAAMSPRWWSSPRYAQFGLRLNY